MAGFGLTKFVGGKKPASSVGGSKPAVASGTVAPKVKAGAVPSVFSFNPASGPVGTKVSVVGSGFSGTQTVDFGSQPSDAVTGAGPVTDIADSPATSFVVNSDTQITATVPLGFSRGPIKVTNRAGSAQSATNFVVTTAPRRTPKGGAQSAPAAPPAPPLAQSQPMTPTFGQKPGY